MKTETVASHINHVAIIPDGNRRWTRKNGIVKELTFYKEGANQFQVAIDHLFHLGVPNVTFWVSSVANLQERPKSLIKATNVLYAKKFNELLQDPRLMSKGVQVNVYGHWRKILERDTVKTIDEIIEKTSGNSAFTLTLLVGYDGELERGEAVLSLINDINTKKELPLCEAKAAESLLRSFAWTGELPDVDLIIRTGSWEDPHNSANFLSFLTGNSQLIFPDVYWPDFNKHCLDNALNEHLNRDRRYGR